MKTFMDKGEIVRYMFFLLSQQYIQTRVATTLPKFYAVGIMTKIRFVLIYHCKQK